MDLKGLLVGKTLVLVYSHTGTFYYLPRMLSLFNTVGRSLRPYGSLVPTTRKNIAGEKLQHHMLLIKVSSGIDDSDSWNIAPYWYDRADVIHCRTPGEGKNKHQLSWKVKMLQTNRRVCSYRFD